MSLILQITDTAVYWTSLAAGVLLLLLTVVMALVAFAPYLPLDVGGQLDPRAAEDYAAEADAEDSAE